MKDSDQTDPVPHFSKRKSGWDRKTFSYQSLLLFCTQRNLLSTHEVLQGIEVCIQISKIEHESTFILSSISLTGSGSREREAEESGGVGLLLLSGDIEADMVSYPVW